MNELFINSDSLSKLIKVVEKQKNYTPESGSNLFDISLAGYTPIAVACAGTNTSSCYVIGTRILDNHIDLRFNKMENYSEIILRYSIVYLKSK